MSGRLAGGRSTDGLVVGLLAGSLLLFGLHQTHLTGLRTPLYEYRWLGLLGLLGLGLLLLPAYEGWRPEFRVHVAAALLILISAGSVVYSVAPGLTVLRAGSLAVMYGALILGTYSTSIRRGPTYVIDAFRWPIALMLVLNVLAIVVPERAFPFYGRFRGLMENPNTLGIYVALFAPLMLHWARSRGFWVGLLPLAWVLLVMSGSRSALLGLGAGVTYYGAARFGPRRGLTLGGLVVAVTAVALFGWTALLASAWPSVARVLASPGLAAVTTDRPPGPEAAGTRPADPDASQLNDPVPESTASSPESSLTAASSPAASLPTPGSGTEPASDTAQTQVEYVKNPAGDRLEHMLTLSGREMMWARALKLISARPWIGYGFGTEEMSFGEQYAQFNPFQGRLVHNSYLGLAVQIGVPGALAFFALPLLLLARELIRLPELANQPLRAALGGILVAGLSQALSESWIYSMGNAFALPFWTAVVLLWRWPRLPRVESPVGLEDAHRTGNSS